jgi:hypothetical protein
MKSKRDLKEQMAFMSSYRSDTYADRNNIDLERYSNAAGIFIERGERLAAPSLPIYIMLQKAQRAVCSNDLQKIRISLGTSRSPPEKNLLTASTVSSLGKVL